MKHTKFLLGKQVLFQFLFDTVIGLYIIVSFVAGCDGE